MITGLLRELRTDDARKLFDHVSKGRSMALDLHLSTFALGCVSPNCSAQLFCGSAAILTLAVFATRCLFCFVQMMEANDPPPSKVTFQIMMSHYSRAGDLKTVMWLQREAMRRFGACSLSLSVCLAVYLLGSCLD